ncbi:hypothetical protein K9O30_09500 [Clostridium bowmanii]|uniref:hypothetical protein n=1 Tax=Clostridium bowmanii TaxID=132925 RepID=UPI001C0C10F4|nr:hypothetical protein [Clostridium bowmanii]MBU3189335.1 hypothetical protein [Clostridium bowmanii]MCA1073951.1 hypothetical protein [Clostridium bowmanii]
MCIILNYILQGELNSNESHKAELKMRYAVEIYFDKDTEEKIMKLPYGIAKRGTS